MKKLLVTLSFFFIIFLTPTPLHAVDKMVFDSTDNYLGGCQLTDESEWELTKDLSVTTFQMWYRWTEGETSLPITVYKDGKEFAKFDAKRSSCDPYQQQWCNADYVMNKTFPKGKYSTKIDKEQQCLKPGSTGTIRLYGAEATTTSTSSTKSTSSCKQSIVLPIVLTAVVSSALTIAIPRMISKKRSAQ